MSEVIWTNERIIDLIDSYCGADAEGTGVEKAFYEVRDDYEKRLAARDEKCSCGCLACAECQRETEAQR